MPLWPPRLRGLGLPGDHHSIRKPGSPNLKDVGWFTVAISTVPFRNESFPCDVAGPVGVQGSTLSFEPRGREKCRAHSVDISPAPSVWFASSTPRES
jgi:hypothetical protein